MNIYSYQRKGAGFLGTRNRAYLADQYGLGKSAQAVIAARIVDNTCERTPRTTIICPAVAVPMWQSEWEKWGGPGQPIILSYDRLRRDPSRAGNPDLVILDEAHYLKNLLAKRSHVAYRLAQNASIAWLLSATPMPNHPGELWAPIKSLWPEIAKEAGCATRGQWLRKFSHGYMGDYGWRAMGIKNGAELRELLAKFVLRRTRDDVKLELPPLRTDIEWLSKGEVEGGAIDWYSQLEQEPNEAVYTSTLRRLLGVAKAEAIAKRIADELQGGLYDKIVVMYYHREVGDLIGTALRMKGISPVGFGGSTPQKWRAAAVDMFQKEPDARVMLVQQQAGGVAITLTAAHEIVLVEPSWTPEDNNQAIARIHRISQKEPCRARVFAVSDTIDGAVMRTCTRKTKMQEEVMG